jgi:hypothetical protein
MCLHRLSGNGFEHCRSFNFRVFAVSGCHLAPVSYSSDLLNWIWALYDRRSVGQSVLEWRTHLGLTTRFLLLSDSCRFVDVGRSLWREDGVGRLLLLLDLASAVILGSESHGTHDHIILSQIWDFPFRGLLRLAGLRVFLYDLGTDRIENTTPYYCSSVVAMGTCLFATLK